MQELLTKLRELTDYNGPNISQRTISIYTGIDQGAISRFIRSGKGIGKEKQEQALKGLRELGQEIWLIVNSKEQ